MCRGLFRANPNARKVMDIPKTTQDSVRDEDSAGFSGRKMGSEEKCEGFGAQEAAIVAAALERAGGSLAETARRLRVALRKCNAVDEKHREALRNITKKAGAFKRGLMPFGKQMVWNLQELSRSYVDVRPGVFAGSVEMILKNVREYREQAELAKLFYMEMATDLKSMKLESQQIADSLRKTEKDLRKAAEGRKTSRNMAEQLSVLAPVVGLGAGFIVGTLSSVSAFLTGTAGVISGLWGTHQSKQLHCEEIALKANADIAHESLVLMERGELVKGMLDYSKSMASVSAYFKKVEEELLKVLQPKKKKFSWLTGIGEDVNQKELRLHHANHVQEMSLIARSCRSYLLKGVEAEVDLQIANESKLDTNYVEDWLRGSSLKNENTKTYRTQPNTIGVKTISFSSHSWMAGPMVGAVA